MSRQVKRPKMVDLPPFPPNVKKYLDMLTYRRPHLSASEAEFIARFIDCAVPNVEIGPEGNRYITIPNPDGSKPTILWSCHTDTVHAMAGRQKLAYDPQLNHVFLAPNEQSNCLGADDGTGVWLLLEMVEAKVPGLYVFNRGEERGGLGSSDATKYDAARFAGITHAIAFDRKGATDIIWEQMPGNCASLTCANAIADRLNLVTPALSPQFAPARGVFTDTANYAEIIPECFNISCGYQGEHNKMELQNLTTMVRLRDAVIDTDWTNLPIERKADDFGFESNWQSSFMSNATDTVKELRLAALRRRFGVTPPPPATTATTDAAISWDDEDPEDIHLTEHELEMLVKKFPEAIVETLMHMGATLADLQYANPGIFDTPDALTQNTDDDNDFFDLPPPLPKGTTPGPFQNSMFPPTSPKDFAWSEDDNAEFLELEAQRRTKKL